LGAGEGRFAVGCRLEVVPLQDAVLPPLSSKVLKFVLERRGGVLGELAASRAGYKPLFVSMLYRGSRPLYSRGEEPVHVRSGEVLGARLGLVGEPRLVDELLSLEGVWETPYGRFRLGVVEVSVESLEGLKLPSPAGEPTGVLRVEARTPVVLASKVLASGDPEALRRFPQLYKLVPSPGAIAAYALRLWNRVAGESLAIYWKDGWNRDAAVVARAAEVLAAELDYSVRPETVVVGRSRPGGRLRLARGWRGWVVYRVASRRLARLLDRVLALANYVGLGRSRGIGLGDVSAEWRPLKS
jgi:hypothetical protein